MIEIELYSYSFVIGINHVGFIILYKNIKKKLNKGIKA